MALVRGKRDRSLIIGGLGGGAEKREGVGHVKFNTYENVGEEKVLAMLKRRGRGKNVLG